MAQETEIKLALHPPDAAVLRAHPLLGAPDGPPRRLLNTYYDTAALTLRAQRVALRERRVGPRAWLTVKTAGTVVGGLSRRGEWEVARPRGPMHFAPWVDDAGLAAELDALVPALVPVFHTDFVRQTWTLAHRGARIEVALDEGSLCATRGGRTRREPVLELELESLEGSVDALLDLAHTLALGHSGKSEHALHLRPETRSKAERGYALYTGEAGRPSKAVPLLLDPRGSVRTAFRQAALACLAHLQANEAGLWTPPTARNLPDPEFIHQARVALRRLRTGLRLFRAHLDPRWAAHWSAHWGALARALGEARNWDVFATEWLPELLPDTDVRREAVALRRWVRAERVRANAAAAAALADPAHTLALLAFTRSLLAVRDGPRGVDLVPWARRVLRQGHERLRQQAREAQRLGPDGRHALRLVLKKQRYAQEFLASLLPAARVARSTAALADAQTLLGELNDLSTAQTLLRQAPPALAPALMAGLLGSLQARLDAGLLALPGMEAALEARI